MSDDTLIKDQLVVYLNDADPYIMEMTHITCCKRTDVKGDPYAGFTWRVLSLDIEDEIADIRLVRHGFLDDHQPEGPERKNVSFRKLESLGTTYKELIENAAKFSHNSCVKK
ncbi:MAG: hypothetical protein ACPGVT_08835 [Maricaulaceae bacterium]